MKHSVIFLPSFWAAAIGFVARNICVSINFWKNLIYDNKNQVKSEREANCGLKRSCLRDIEVCILV